MDFAGITTLFKEVLALAKKAKNQAVIEKLMDLQEGIFDMRDENHNLKLKIEELNKTIQDLEKCPEIEENLEFSGKGFCIKKDAETKIPYCSHCWATKHQLIPLSQQTHGGWWKYTCGTCKTDVCVMNEQGKPLNHGDGY